MAEQERICANCGNVRRLEYGNALACSKYPGCTTWGVKCPDESCDNWKSPRTASGNVRKGKLPIKVTCPSEEDEQIRLIDWCNAMCELRPEFALIFHVRNGGTLGGGKNGNAAKEGAKFKRMGVRAGQPDLCFPVPSADGRYHSLHIEMKRQDGGSGLSDAQKERIALLNRFGNLAIIAKGFAESKKVIEEYLGL